VALDNRCPHRGGPLSRGRVERAAPDGSVELSPGEPGIPAVRCPLHGWLFSLEDGRCLNIPGTCTRAYRVDSGPEGEPILSPR